MTKIIQPVALHAPEVLIEAPWDYTTDLRNLGAVVFEVFRNVTLFTGEPHALIPGSDYDFREHIHQIIDVCGRFPRDLLSQGDQDIVQSLFDAEGMIKDEFNTGSKGRTESNPLKSIEYPFWSGLEPKDILQFIDFLRAMMKINPKDRTSIGDLIEKDWLEELFG